MFFGISRIENFQPGFCLIAGRSIGKQCLRKAITAMNRKSTATPTNVRGSVGLTSTSMLARTRVSANAASRPIAIPITLR